MGSGFLIHVAPGEGLPLYRQIVEQVKAAIASGLLEEGDQLPSHRDLARTTLVAPLTVKRAYDVLEQEGLVATRRGLGTFVEARSTQVRSDANAELDERARALIRQAEALGVSEAELMKRLRSTWRAARKGRGKP